MLRDLAPVQISVLVLHAPEAPRLDVLAEFGVRPWVGEGDLGVRLGGQRHPRAEQALVALEQQVAPAADALARHDGQHLGDVRVDHLLAGGQRDRDPVVAIDDEMQVADAVDVDGRDLLAAPLRQGEPLPPLPHPAGGGPEPAVEIAARVDRADHGVQPDRLQAERPLALPAQGCDDLVKREDEVDVVRPPAQPVRQPGQHLASPRAEKVILHIRLRESGISGHGGAPAACRRCLRLAGCRANAGR